MNNLSNEANMWILAEAKFNLAFYEKEFKKLMKNGFLSGKTKILLKSDIIKEINLFKEITKSTINKQEK